MKNIIIGFGIVALLVLSSCTKTTVSNKKGNKQSPIAGTWIAQPVVAKIDFYADNKLVFSQSDSSGYSDKLVFSNYWVGPLYLRYMDVFKATANSSELTTYGSYSPSEKDTVLLNSIHTTPILIVPNDTIPPYKIPSSDVHIVEVYVTIQHDTMYYYTLRKVGEGTTQTKKLSTVIYIKQ